MIIILKQDANETAKKELINQIEAMGLTIHYSQGKHTSLLGLIGDTSVVDIESILAKDIVADVKRIQEPYKNANRKFHPRDTIVDVNGIKIGGGNFQVIAGPCSVESDEQISSIAKDVLGSGATLLRGGAFKPRTSPYSFQGMGAKGLDMLQEAKKLTGLPVVTEIMDASHISLFEGVDVLQVGARNMQNFELLKQLGSIKKPILLKRGLANTIEELLMSAEYIMASGNENIILCERGIRTFETAYRNTLDISAIPMLKEKTHLPVIIDPSHAAGIPWMVEPLSLAAIAAGADGLIIEVHNDPSHAKSDGQQALSPAQFDVIMKKLKSTAEFFGKKVG
ncbi:MAG: 3-deoxy-7-phosphoheptulonate synthase [Eubacteriales bacterium]